MKQPDTFGSSAGGEISPEKWQETEGEVNRAEIARRAATESSQKIFAKTRIPKKERETMAKEEVAKKIGSTRVSKYLLDAEETLEHEAEEALGDEHSLERSLVSLRFANLREAVEKNNELEKERSGLLEERVEVMKGIEGTPIGPEQQALTDIEEEIEAVEKRRQELLVSNPEAFFGLHLRELQGYKRQMEHGRIAELPYTQKKREEVEAHLRAGIPVMLYGELGAGKTEIAMHAARKMMEGREDIDARIEEDFQKWLAANPDAAGVAQKKQREELERVHRSAVVIAGSKHTTPADFYGHQVLSIDKIDEKEQDEWIEKVVNKVNAWKKENPNATPEEIKMYNDAVIAGYTGKGGTISKYLFGQIYNAAKEGRPVIIDEVNAIPHETLISLNYIMTRKPGEIITVPQTGEQIEIKEGFGFILTGNLNIDGVEKYKQRQDLDPAFLNRLHTIEYDYLPQKYGVPLEEAGETENQLFKLLVAKTMDRNGNLEGRKGTMDDLWRLSGFARLTQEAFSGHKVSDAYYFQQSGGRQKTPPQLKGTVMSVRTIERIIDRWTKEGFNKELDHYLWSEFIATATNPSDRAYLYQVANKQFGFFQGSGWEQNPDYGAGDVRSFDINAPENRIKENEKEFVGPRQIVEATFGHAPERAKWPEAKVSEEAKAQEEELQKSAELMELQKQLAEIDREFADLRAQAGEVCEIPGSGAQSGDKGDPIPA